MRRDVPSPRRRVFVGEFHQSLRAACERRNFRVLHYSVQRDHLHLLIEADSKAALARAVKSIGARIARAVNRVFRRTGAVLDGRFHLHVLRTPRERHAALASPDRPEVASPRTWLARVGWRRHGLIDPAAMPGF